MCLLLTGCFGCVCTCRTEPGLCSLPRFLLFTFWPTFLALWLAGAALATSLNLQNPVIQGFNKQWSLLDDSSWNPASKVTSRDGEVLLPYTETTGLCNLDCTAKVTDYGQSHESLNYALVMEVPVSGSSESGSFPFLTGSSAQPEDYLIQVKGTALPQEQCDAVLQNLNT